MYKIIVEVPGQAWSIVNTKDIRQKVPFFALSLAKSTLCHLLDGTLHINDLIGD